MGHAFPMLCNLSPAKIHGKSVCAGCSSSPRHNSWPGAVHVLPTSLLQPLMRLAQSFVMARPDMPDCPIVYASQRFLDLTGYPRCAFKISACKCSLSMPASIPAPHWVPQVCFIPGNADAQLQSSQGIVHCFVDCVACCCMTPMRQSGVDVVHCELQLDATQ